MIRTTNSLVAMLAATLVFAAVRPSQAANLTWNPTGAGSPRIWDVNNTGAWQSPIGAKFQNGDAVTFNRAQDLTGGTVAIDASGVNPASVILVGGFGAAWTFTGGDITGATTTVSMNQDNVGNFDRAGSYTFGGGTFLTANNGAINYRPSVTGDVQFGSGNINLNAPSGHFRFQPTVAGANLTNNFVVGASGSTWHPTTNGGTMSGTVTMNGNLTLQANSRLTNNVTLTSNRSLIGAMWGGQHPIVSGNINGAGVHNLTLTTNNSGDSYLYLEGAGNWNVKDIIKTGTSATGLVRINTDESTFFNGVKANGGAFRMQEGNVQWQDATPNVTFDLLLSPGAGFYAPTPLTMTVNNGGLLGGTGNYASKSSYGVHTWTNAMQINVGNNGELSPGFSTGVMSVTGGVSFGAGSQLTIEIDSDGTVAGVDFDQLNVSGAVTGLSNANVVVNIDPSLIFEDLASNSYRFLTSGNDLSGLSIGSLTFGSAPGGTWSGDLVFGNGFIDLVNVTLTVPEPATMMLVGLGATALVVGSRRRRVRG